MNKAKENMKKKYTAGERLCPICSAPLPAHDTWPGARYRFCGSPECTAKVSKLEGGRFIRGANEGKCEREDCRNYVQPGRYRLGPSKLTCSGECWSRSRGLVLVKYECGCGCGTAFSRTKRPQSACSLVFFSIEHCWLYNRNKRLAESCGAFFDIVHEYFSTFAVLHYRDLAHVRAALRPFFRFLNLQGVRSLNDVTPNTVTQFLAHATKSGRHIQPSDISCIAVFFRWMIAEGRRTAANPIVGLLHSQPQKCRLPRPLEADELQFAWQLLNERGNARLRFAAAAAEEAGLRIGEICRLRIEDVDLTQQRFFVRLPNKTNCERWAFFGEKTKRYFAEWMAERDGNCGHEFLLHNIRSHPLKGGALGPEFRQVMCKTFLHETVNQTGFDNWSTHRLRHTMASNLVSGGADAATVMASGGWTSYEAMAGYARIDTRVARRDYDQAMRHAQALKELPINRKSLTPADLLDRHNIIDAPQIATSRIPSNERFDSLLLDSSTETDKSAAVRRTQ